MAGKIQKEYPRILFFRDFTSHGKNYYAIPCFELLGLRIITCFKLLDRELGEVAMITHSGQL